MHILLQYMLLPKYKML